MRIHAPQVPPSAPARYVLVDCPWKYNDRRAVRKDNPQKKPKSGVGASGKYGKGCMTLEQLIELGPLLRAVTTSDAYLFHWVTMPLLPQGIQVLEAWGWRYVGVAMVWVKAYPRLFDEGRILEGLFRGPGYYVPSNIELLLLGIRGKPWHKTTGAKPQQVLIAPHPRDPMTGKIRHSRKPEEIQDRIDRWLGPQSGGAPRLELFATRDRPGWHCLGGDVTGRDIREDLVDYADRIWCAAQEAVRSQLLLEGIA